MTLNTQFDRQLLRNKVSHTYRAGGGSRPDVLGVTHDGIELVLKDFNGCDRWFSIVFGRLLAAREARALSTLQGLQGVPRLVARVGPRAILMQRVDAVPVLKTEIPVDWPVFFAHFEKLVAAMHERGLAHCDLRSPHNILVDQKSQTWLVDLTGAWHRGAGWNIPSGWLYRQLAGVDRSAIVKLKLRVAPELLSTGEALAQHRPHILARPARAFGQAVRRVARVLFTGGGTR